MQELYYRKGQKDQHRYYATYSDAASGVPSFEHVALMGPMERGWERFTMQDLPGGVIMIKKMPWPSGDGTRAHRKNHTSIIGCIYKNIKTFFRRISYEDQC